MADDESITFDRENHQEFFDHTLVRVDEHRVQLRPALPAIVTEPKYCFTEETACRNLDLIAVQGNDGSASSANLVNEFALNHGPIAGTCQHRTVGDARKAQPHRFCRHVIHVTIVA